MNSKDKFDKAASLILEAAKRLRTPGSSCCVLIWGPDLGGMQWRTYREDCVPVCDSEDGRKILASELRSFADMIENEGQPAEETPGG